MLHLAFEEFERTIHLLDAREATLEALVVVLLLAAVYRSCQPSPHRTVWWAVAVTLTAVAFDVLVASTGRRLKELLSQEANDASGRAISVVRLLDARSLTILLACCALTGVLAAAGAVTAWQGSHSKRRALGVGVGVVAIFAPMLVGIDFALLGGTGHPTSVCDVPQEVRALIEDALSSLRVGCGTTGLLLVLAGVSRLVALGRAKTAASTGRTRSLESRVLYGLAAVMAAAAVALVIKSLPYATESPPPEPLPSLAPCDCQGPRGASVYLDDGSPADWESASELARKLGRTGPPSVTVSGATPLAVVSAALATIRARGVANVCLQGVEDPGFDSRVLGRIRTPRVWHVLASSVSDPTRPGRRVAVEGRTVADEVPAIVQQLRRGDTTMLLFESAE